MLNSIWQHLITLTQTEKITVIITTHYIEEARMANVVGLMRAGRLLAENAPEELMSQYRLETLEEVFLKLCMSDTSIKAAALANSTGLNGSAGLHTLNVTDTNDSHSIHSHYHQMATNGDLNNGLKVLTQKILSLIEVIIQLKSLSVSVSIFSIQWKQRDELYVTSNANPSQS